MNAPQLSALSVLESLLIAKQSAIEEWFDKAYQLSPPLLYNSVDLRYSGIKLVPVDTNIYPAGFNHLSPSLHAYAKDAISHYLNNYYPACHSIVILMENHTRNLGYLENIATLLALIRASGKATEVAYTDSTIEATPMMLPSGAVLKPIKLMRDGQFVVNEGNNKIDLLILNNDLSNGVPALLEGCSTPIVPSPELGWYKRRKSHHFALYAKVIKRFATDFGCDPFLFTAAYRSVQSIRFREKLGLPRLSQEVNELLREITLQYQAYHIAQVPYLFIKADNGTYGMGVMTAHSSEEITQMNKKRRHSMDVGKGGVINNEILIQEGIPTCQLYDGKPAELMVYLINGRVVDYIWRVNEHKDTYSSLNSTGMKFYSANELSRVSLPCFGLIARLASLAASLEREGNYTFIS
ncbi:MAG: glutamate--cysteine ligase [Burkholderiales bacterium]